MLLKVSQRGTLMLGTHLGLLKVFAPLSLDICRTAA